MTGADSAAVEAAVADAHRRGWALALAATVRVARDLDVAEECVQEAYAAALAAWPREGIPRSPVAWVTTSAKRRAIDLGRREQVLRSKLPLLVVPEQQPEEPTPPHTDEPVSDIADERLRLVFLCCHPALAQEAQLALTLRLVCGVPTADIARAFLVPETTMGARLTRAKKKISAARIPFRVPQRSELPTRLRAVLGVVHVLFTVGHTAPSGSSLVRVELVDHAVHLARMLHALMPEEPEVQGLLALLLATDARRSTRVDEQGRLLRLAEQDRSQWDRAAIAEAHDLVVESLRGRSPGRYALQAAIASLHAEAESFEGTDWAQILRLYDELLRVWPSPVVALNRTVALAEVDGPDRALAEVERLEAGHTLDAYPYLHAVRADLLHRQGLGDAASAAYRKALELTTNDAERAFLTDRLNECLAAPQGR